MSGKMLCIIMRYMKKDMFYVTKTLKKLKIGKQT